MQDELEEVLDQIWECQGLDPFRDDPVGMVPGTNTNIVEEEENWDKDVEIEQKESPCTCGNCVHLPTQEEERLCCRRLMGWQRDYKSTGANP